MITNWLLNQKKFRNRSRVVYITPFGQFILTELANISLGSGKSRIRTENHLLSSVAHLALKFELLT